MTQEISIGDIVVNNNNYYVIVTSPSDNGYFLGVGLIDEEYQDFLTI